MFCVVWGLGCAWDFVVLVRRFWFVPFCVCGGGVVCGFGANGLRASWGGEMWVGFLVWYEGFYVYGRGGSGTRRFCLTSYYDCVYGDVRVVAVDHSD